MCCGKYTTIVGILLAALAPILMSNMGDGAIRNYYLPCLDGYFKPLKGGCKPPSFTVNDIPDLTGKVAIVTGSI